MSRSAEARAQFGLLRAIHYSLIQYMPNVQDVEQGRYGPGSMDNTARLRLKDTITLLRNDIRNLPTTLEQIDFRQLERNNDKNAVKSLTEALGSLLDMMEKLVHDAYESPGEVIVSQDDACLDRFPHLVILRRSLQQGDTSRNVTAKPNINNTKITEPYQNLGFKAGVNNKPSKIPIPVFQRATAPKQQIRSSIDIGDVPEHMIDTKRDQTIRNLSSKYVGKSHVAFATVLPKIHFPNSVDGIMHCQLVLEDFGKAILKIFPGNSGQWNVDEQSEDYDQAEVSIIQEAHTFSKSSASLYNLIVKSINCQFPHRAGLNLSGFHSHRLEMFVGTCQEEHWVPTSFTRCVNREPPILNHSYNICGQGIGGGGVASTLDLSFSESTIWREHTLQPSSDHDAATLTVLPRLTHLLQSEHPQSLSRRDKTTLGFLLAYMCFRLYGSPWMQQGLARDDLLMLTDSEVFSSSKIAHPHVLHVCTLGDNMDPQAQMDYIASLVILILELEAGLRADWRPDDEEFDTGKKSNQIRLGRILEDPKWINELSDGYRNIGSACLELESRIEDVDHPQLQGDARSLAVLYRYVVNPLYQLLVSSFGSAAEILQRLPGFSVQNRRHRRQQAEDTLKLFDDFEANKDDEKSKVAVDILRKIDKVVMSIGNLRACAPKVGLAYNMQTQLRHPPERIRIAILDTGVDSENKMIRDSLKPHLITKQIRIKERKSWVGSDEQYQDICGHGTHVARLLLRIAPEAELYIAKISDQVDGGPESLQRIADAINWAVDKWDVHIISMSFGFYSSHKDVGDAIDKAIKADKILIAAASNEGANKGRSLPARTPGVLCIHACDGKGNKGTMNPRWKENEDNFTVVGVGVPSQWKKKDVYKSGTSYSTPIAAGIAANILEFSNYKCRLTTEEKKDIYRFKGIRAVFRLLCRHPDGDGYNKPDNYDYVSLLSLWYDKNGLRRSDDEIARMIEEVISSL